MCCCYPDFSNLHDMRDMGTNFSKHPASNQVRVHFNIFHGKRKKISPWKDRKRWWDNLKEVSGNIFDIHLIQSDILVRSFRRINFVSGSRWHVNHGIEKRLNETSKVVISVKPRKRRKESSIWWVSSEKLCLGIYIKVRNNPSFILERIPVWAISRSIMTLIRFNSDVRESKMFSRTAIIISTSEGGQISQIVIARTIYSGK